MILKNKTVIITGGASGIGKELVKLLSKNNKVILIDKKYEQSVKLARNNENISFYQTNISDEEEVKKTSKLIKYDYRKVDVLINNAAIQRTGDFADTEFKDVITTNLLGTMTFTKAMIPLIKEAVQY